MNTNPDRITQAELDALGTEVLSPFDVHAHTGADIDGTVRSSAEHVADLARIGGRSAISPLCAANGYRVENLRVIAESRRHPDRLIPFARLDPSVDSASDAADSLTAGARGFSLHPRCEAFRADHLHVDEIVGVAYDANVPVVVSAECGDPEGRALLELAARHPSCPIVIAHTAISALARLWHEIEGHPNLFFDTARFDATDLRTLFSLVPPSQILLGSDAPYGDVELAFRLTLRCGLAVGLSTEQLALVAGGQLQRLLDGQPPAYAGPAPERHSLGERRSGRIGRSSRYQGGPDHSPSAARDS